MSGEDGADGSDGTNGSDGSDGTDATQTAEGSVYYTVSQSDNPGVPSASNYNFTDGSFTGLTADWQVDPVTVTIENTSNTFWMSRWRAVQAPGASTATITFQTPIGSLVLGTNIQSDNFVEGSAGWRIGRASGEAEFGAATIRGTLTADQVNIGSGLTASGEELIIDIAFVRGLMKSGTNIGTINLDSISQPNFIESYSGNVLIDDASVSVSNRTVSITTDNDIFIYGDVSIDAFNSTLSFVSTAGNIRVYGNATEGSGTLQFVASQGCVEILGNTTGTPNITDQAVCAAFTP